MLKVDEQLTVISIFVFTTMGVVQSTVATFMTWKCLDIPRPVSGRHLGTRLHPKTMLLAQKCIALPRPHPWKVGAALGLLSIVVMIAIQGAFLSVQLAQSLVFAVLMPVGPLALSWVVNHLYATPLGKVRRQR